MQAKRGLNVSIYIPFRCLDNNNTTRAASQQMPVAVCFEAPAAAMHRAAHCKRQLRMRVCRCERWFKSKKVSRAHQHVLEAHHVLEARGHRLPRTLCFPELTLPGKLLQGRGSMDHPPTHQRSPRRRLLLPPLHLLALLQLRLLARGHHPLPVSTVATTCWNSRRSLQNVAREITYVIKFKSKTNWGTTTTRTTPNT